MRRQHVWGLVGLCVALAGCSGGGSSGGGSGSAGEVSVALTDAASDEIDVFELEVTSFRFERANGASVEVLSQSTRVDFAQLVEVSEVIATRSIPAGTYTSAFMRVNFGAAAVLLTGNTTAASLEDDQGNPLTGVMDLEIVFPNGGLVVGPATGHFAEVDFDLDQSLTVDAGANVVEVSPVFFASLDPATPKDIRTPGLASGFDGTSSFALDVRRHLGLVSRGTLTIQTDAATVFDLQTQSLTGAAGYAALESLGDDTLVAVTGPLDPATRTLAADRVVLIPDNLDAVEGLVVARSGGPGDDATLTLRGVSVRRSAGAVTFNDTVTLSASFAQTVVRRRGSATALDTDAINVGQRIVAYGVLSGATLDLTQAGAGFVRLVQTGFGGAVTAAASGSLTLDLARIGARRTTAFDFSVDGVAQADPDALVVDTGALSLSGITTGSAVRVLGFVAPVTTDATATPDVVANTVIDRTGAASLLHVGYFPASTSAVATTTTASLQLDVSTASVAVVDQGLVSPVTLSADPTVTGGQGAFAVRRGFQITLYGNFSSFDQRLRAELAGGARLRRLTAIGGYTAGTTTLDARRVVAVLR